MLKFVPSTCYRMEFIYAIISVALHNSKRLQSLVWLFSRKEDMRAEIPFQIYFSFLKYAHV